MLMDPYEKRSNPWGDVERHVGRYGAPFFIPEIIDHAKGSYVYTEEGRRILDFTSGQMSSTIGHSHPEVVATLQESAGRLDHLFSGMLSRPSINLCTHIAETVTDPLTKVIPLSTGSEVNEAALRMAKLVTGKFEVVSFNRSWHGLTEASAGATYASARKSGLPGTPGQLAIPTPYEYRPDFVDRDGKLDWQKQLDYGFTMVDAQSVGSLAACIVEPAAVGCTVMDVIAKENLLAAAREKGDYLAAALKQLVEKHEVVGDARGRGLLQGIEIVKDKMSKERSEAIGDRITARCLELGLHMNIVCLPGMGGVFRIAPPLTVSYEELEEGISMLDQAITDVENIL